MKKFILFCALIALFPLLVFGSGSHNASQPVGGAIAPSEISVSGDSTLGDAAGDTVTINGTDIIVPNGVEISTVAAGSHLVITTDGNVGISSAPYSDYPFVIGESTLTVDHDGVMYLEGELGIGVAADGKSIRTNGAVVFGGNADFEGRIRNSGDADTYLDPQTDEWMIHAGSICIATFKEDTTNSLVRIYHATFTYAGGADIPGTLTIGSMGSSILFTGNYTIGADTSDGSDTRLIAIAGGGTAAASRGAYVNLSGNERAASDAGALALGAGDASASSMTFATKGTVRMMLDPDGAFGVDTETPESTMQLGDLTDGTTLYMQIDVEGGSPPATDCDAAAEDGRMIIDRTNNRLYICNQGAARGWDYIALTD